VEQVKRRARGAGDLARDFVSEKAETDRRKRGIRQEREESGKNLDLRAADKLSITAQKTKANFGKGGV